MTVRASILPRLCAEERAATSVEYSLVATLVSVAIVGAAIALGASLGETWLHLYTRLAGG